MKITVKDNNVVIEELENFTLEQTLDCGQAFRWQAIDENTWHGVAFGRYLKLGMCGSTLTLYDVSLEEFETVWKQYLDLERDYKSIISILSSDPTLKTATSYAGGIRILNQDPWEALCSFIISQNNNIPRIKGIITRLCENFGEEICDGHYSFPSAEKIASLSLEELSVLRSGFRAKYILDAAKKVSEGIINLENLKMIDIDIARNALMTIYGVGAKVADCALLFGLGHIDAFPKDVWIKRVMDRLYDGELPNCAKGYSGIAQQYLFHFARLTKLEI